MKRPTKSKTNQASLSAGFFSPKEKEVKKMAISNANGNATKAIINDAHLDNENHTAIKPRRKGMKAKDISYTTNTANKKKQDDYINIDGELFKVRAPDSELVEYLHYFYKKCVRGECLIHKTANDELCIVSSTDKLSKIGRDYGLSWNKKQKINPRTRKHFTEFRLDDNSLVKTQKILERQGVI